MKQRHGEQIARWAEFIRMHPTEWKKIHTQFIDAIFLKHQETILKLRETPEGREKIKEIFGEIYV